MTAKMMNIKDVLMLMHIDYTALISLRPYEPKCSCIFFHLIPNCALCKSSFFMIIEFHSKIFHTGKGGYLNG